MDEAQFYLYFPAQGDAEQAAGALRDQDYTVEVRLGADEQNWLALAKKPLADDQLDVAEEQLFELAESLGGEFDGFDRPTGEFR